MNIIINCKHMDSTQNLKNYAEEKIGRFDKYLNDITEANVTLSVEKYRHKAEVHLKVSGSLIQAESITDEMYSAIDEVVEKLARQVRKHKDKIITQRKGKGKAEVDIEITDPVPSIIKKKSEIKPMSVEEAAMQMDLMGRDFFVYTNASSGDINVLYKRADGNFGLIEPVK